ncbi:hypothetical protein SLU01_12790 [Sporosarcina luteola]|uniref:PilZ domain-containing protein n=1 Tax=Sporosarcina luteola TaxID=582850 RepID=A0A511Z689_9BACL|nr:PilZ domain-containing protein [Sporosarcina luteola]GEN82967.1 hypothetical protein SLU01_12790 [Sporosarcina luteola]
MLYKRHEYFRHSFGTPLEATFRILVEGSTNESNPGKCLLLDISPGGSKIISSFDLPVEGMSGSIHLKLEFTLFETPIDIDGKIAWKKHTVDGFQYGIDFVEDPSVAKLIVDELKLRRRTEIGPTDGKKS